MTATTSNRTARNRDAARAPREKEIETSREITQDLVNYLTNYAREYPGYAALMCIGIGFVVGWKLKPY